MCLPSVRLVEALRRALLFHAQDRQGELIVQGELMDRRELMVQGEFAAYESEI